MITPRVRSKRSPTLSDKCFDSDRYLALTVAWSQLPGHSCLVTVAWSQLLGHTCLILMFFKLQTVFVALAASRLQIKHEIFHVQPQLP